MRLPRYRPWLWALLAFSLPAQDRPSLREQAEIGAAYAAKVVASAVFVAGRDLDSVLAGELAAELDAEKLLRPLMRIDVDETAQTVTVSVLGVERTAVHRPGLGCTLALGKTADELRAEVAGLTLPDPRAAEDLPAGEAIPELEAVLDQAFAEPEQGPRRRTRAIVVVARGRVIAERYAAGFTRDTRHAGWSMAKSVTAALVAVRGLEPDAKVDAPEWRADGDPRQALTIRQLLQMSSGLRWDERYAPGADPVRMLFAAPDAAAFAAGKELAHTPGTHCAYSSGTTNLLSRALRASFAAWQDYLAFPRRALFDRTGMRSAILEPDASGTFVGSSFLWATARDWARFGLLILCDGQWGGVRILPEGYVQSCATPAPAAPAGRYGSHFWLNAGDAAGTRPYPELPGDVLLALGHEGQVVAVFPSRDLVVVRLGCTKAEGLFDLGGFLAAVLAAVPSR